MLIMRATHESKMRNTKDMKISDSITIYSERYELLFPLTILHTEKTEFRL